MSGHLNHILPTWLMQQDKDRVRKKMSTVSNVGNNSSCESGVWTQSGAACCMQKMLLLGRTGVRSNIAPILEYSVGNIQYSASGAKRHTDMTGVSCKCCDNWMDWWCWVGCGCSHWVPCARATSAVWAYIPTAYTPATDVLPPFNCSGHTVMNLTASARNLTRKQFMVWGWDVDLEWPVSYNFLSWIAESD